MLATKAIDKRLRKVERRRPKLPVLVLFQRDYDTPNVFVTHSPSRAKDWPAPDPTIYIRADFPELERKYQLVVVQYEQKPIPDWSAQP